MSKQEVIDRLFRVERETYAANKAELLAYCEGGWTAIFGAKVVGVWPTMEQTAKFGYAASGGAPVMIRQVLDDEPVVALPWINQS